jgi:hypothetical protein
VQSKVLSEVVTILTSANEWASSEEIVLKLFHFLNAYFIHFDLNKAEIPLIMFSKYVKGLSEQSVRRLEPLLEENCDVDLIKLDYSNLEVKGTVIHSESKVYQDLNVCAKESQFVLNLEGKKVESITSEFSILEINVARELIFHEKFNETLREKKIVFIPKS